jgi:hypothetical protein
MVFKILEVSVSPRPKCEAAWESTINLNELGIPNHNLSDLYLPFTEDEVWLTIKKLPSDKAPGPDGLTGRFYKSCWTIIKHDIMRATSAVWSRKMLGFSALNTAYFMLLPKKRRCGPTQIL